MSADAPGIARQGPQQHRADAVGQALDRPMHGPFGLVDLHGGFPLGICGTLE